jgi:hypothetical protein
MSRVKLRINKIKSSKISYLKISKVFLKKKKGNRKRRKEKVKRTKARIQIKKKIERVQGLENHNLLLLRLVE